MNALTRAARVSGIQQFADPCPDWVIVARVDVEVDRVIDYHLIPAGAMPTQMVFMGTDGRSPLERFRTDNLNGLELLVGLPSLAEDEVEGAGD